MAMDTIDAALLSSLPPPSSVKKVPSIEALNSEMPCREFGKGRNGGRRMLKTLLNRLRLRRAASADISEPDPTYKVAYLGNVVTGWAKGAGCVEKPLATLWRNYTQSSRPDVCMQLTVSAGGLKATTRDHGLTEYWANRLTTCAAPPQFPRLFCWVYRHEGRRLRHELRCHAVLCPTTSVARQIEEQLKHSLALALAEFKRDKISRQNARLSLANCVYDNPSIPRRKILLSTGQTNYRPPLERSKSAPKLTIIEENLEEEEDIAVVPKSVLKHSESTSALLEKRRNLLMKLNGIVEEEIAEKPEDEDLLDERSEMILEELVQDSMRSDLMESCQRGWLEECGAPDSDEGSLSSGCESASTVTSEGSPPLGNRKTEMELDFKLGEWVGVDHLRKYQLEGEEVSLVPVGETQEKDFSSLKVYKRRAEKGMGCGGEVDEEEENGSACSDESGYDEDGVDGASTVGSVILV